MMMGQEALSEAVVLMVQKAMLVVAAIMELVMV